MLGNVGTDPSLRVFDIQMRDVATEAKGVCVVAAPDLTVDPYSNAAHLTLYKEGIPLN